MNLRMRFEVLRRDGFRCVYCGVTSTEARLEVDHIQPISDGGTDERENLVAACFDCNRGKSASPLGDADVQRFRAENAELSKLQGIWSDFISWAISPDTVAGLRGALRRHGYQNVIGAFEFVSEFAGLVWDRWYRGRARSFRSFEHSLFKLGLSEISAKRYSPTGTPCLSEETWRMPSDEDILRVARLIEGAATGCESLGDMKGRV